MFDVSETLNAKKKKKRKRSNLHLSSQEFVSLNKVLKLKKQKNTFGIRVLALKKYFFMFFHI